MSPAEEEDIDGEFLGEGESAGRGLREVRCSSKIAPRKVLLVVGV